jgi:hypothetical protein
MYDVTSFNSGSSFAAGWTIASIILAIVGGILTLVLFLKKSNKEKYNKNLLKLYDFLNFDFLTLEVVLKFMYTAVTIFVVLNSFNFISVNFLGFILYLVVGIILTRVSFEMAMLIIKICKNTTEINDKLNKEEKETKKK